MPPIYTVRQWMKAVADNETRLGYRQYTMATLNERDAERKYLRDDVPTGTLNTVMDLYQRVGVPSRCATDVAIETKETSEC